MRDDILIGSNGSGGSAILVRNFKDRTHISQNDAEYWITEGYFRVNLRIGKTTPEGKNLSSMLEAKLSDEEISKWITDLVLDKISHNLLLKKIEAKVKEAFRNGREYQAAKLREALVVQ